MAVSTTTPYVEQDGNGVTTAFTFAYKYIASANFKVYLYDEDDGSSVLQTLTTHYTVTATGAATNGVYPGATITFTTAPGSDKKVRIFRDPALTQEFDFDAESDPLPVLTRAADLQAMRDQALDHRLDRAVRIADGEVSSLDPTLPETVTADGGEALCLNGAKTALIWGAQADGTISSVMANFVSSASLAAAREELGVGLTDTPTFTGVILSGAAAGGTALDVNPTAASTAMGFDIDQTGPTNGASLGSEFYFNDVLVNSDQAVVTSTVFAGAFRYGFGGAAAIGQRAALLGRAVLNTATGNVSESLRHYVGVSGEAQASDDDGGTNTGAGAQGSILGVYASSIAASGATNLRGVVGAEINTSVRTGATVKDHVVLRLCPWADHAVVGAGLDAALQICAQSGSVPFEDYGIVFDTSSSGTAANLFGASATFIASLGSDTLLNGVDFSSVTFTGSAFKSTGFSISPAGLINATDQVRVTGAVPAFVLSESGVAANSGKWAFQGNSTQFFVACMSDDEATVNHAMDFSRSGSTPTLLKILTGLQFSVQDLNGAGAVDVVTAMTKWGTTGVNAGTLADGVEGQVKIILMDADGGDGTLTPTNLANGSTITFNDIGDAVLLAFIGTEWWVIANNGCTVA